MSRFYGYDILDAIKDRLEDETYGINAYIESISCDRGEVAQLVTGIYTGIGDKQDPECFIDLQDSETNIEELIGGSQLEYVTEIYPADIWTTLKSNDDNLEKWSEIHIEALEKCLHGYKTADITWVYCTGTIRASGVDRNNLTAKISGVKIEIRIN